MPARFTRLGGCLLAAAAILSAPLAGAADIEGYARLSGFSWKLVDLNPADGIAPEITFTETGGASWAQRLSVFPHLIDVRDTYGATHISAPDGSAGTAISASENLASARAAGPSDVFLAYAMEVSTFELTPYTRVEFTALAEVDTTHPGTQTGGWVLFEGHLVDGVTAEPVSTFKLLLNSEGGPASQVFDSTLSSGAAATIGYFRRDSMAYANLQPVPEPGTWGMLLAGLGLVGWRARRKLG